MSEYRIIGTVKWYNKHKGFGFLATDEGEDVFLHHSAFGDDVRQHIRDGARVSFEIEQRKKGPSAAHVRPDDTPAPAQIASAPADDHASGEGTFAELGLDKNLLRAINDVGYTQPTPIQEQAIPHVLAGVDVLGCAQTGTGKTAAFALPTLQNLGPYRGQGRRPIRALVLSPTRELAIQIGDSFRDYARHSDFRYTTIYGGVGQNPQVKALQKGVDVLVATPGRLLDLMGQGYVKLDRVEIFILDEADRMLDMGFIHDVRRVVKAVPKQRQTLLFSATMPGEIIDLASSILKNPVRVDIEPGKPTVEAIEQAVLFVERKQKQATLENLLSEPTLTRVLVFTRTKHGANRVVKNLSRRGIQAEPIHGNKSQAARQTALRNFRSGRTRVLVATDVAARGIDVEDISHVIQFDLPNEPETYVHRIGRTGRAGAVGTALAFCASDERAYLKSIEKLIQQRVPVVRDAAEVA